MATETTFRRYGRSLHANIQTAAQLRLAAELEPAHWVATTAPTAGLNVDPAFLALVAGDGAARLTREDLRRAIRWLLTILRDEAGVTARSDTLDLAAIDTDNDEGRRAYETAVKVLERLDDEGAGAVTLAQVRRIRSEVEAADVSAAGVVLPEAAADEKIRAFLADIVATTGGSDHPAGAKGVGAADLDRFSRAARAHLAWRKRGEPADGAESDEIHPFGADTDGAYDLFQTARGKFDQYFAQCEAVALDGRFTQRMGWTETELNEVDFDDPSALDRVLREAPLAKASPERIFRWDGPVNPRDVRMVEHFRRSVADAIFGEPTEALTATAWTKIKTVFEPRRAWLAAKAGGAVESLGVETLQRYLDDPSYAEAVGALIAASRAKAVEDDNLRLLEKILLFQAHLLDLANNFISFPHLYDPDSRALFELGTLVMDGRRFTLAVRADDPKAHAKVARTSNMFLLYVEVRPDSGAPYTAAVPVTDGGKGNLVVGKRGVFYDLDGAECDAAVVHIVDNPISVREAIISPFKRLARLVTGKLESLTAVAEKKLDTTTTTALNRVAPASPAAAPKSSLAAGGMLMGAGVAVAAVGSALAYIAKTIAEAGFVAIVFGLLGAVALVILPTSVLAILKLRRRDLSAILEGSGWGVNARMRLTRRQGKTFTQRPAYPSKAGSLWRRIRGRLLLAAAVVILAGAGGAWALWPNDDPTETAPAAPPATQPAPVTER